MTMHDWMSAHTASADTVLHDESGRVLMVRTAVVVVDRSTGTRRRHELDGLNAAARIQLDVELSRLNLFQLHVRDSWRVARLGDEDRSMIAWPARTGASTAKAGERAA
jgi:hypothetical protein